jgi:hypothetical protein
MASGDDGGDPEDGPILSPEELDISEDEHVREIDEGRYVVSADVLAEEGPAPGPAESGPTENQSTDEHDDDARALDSATVHEWLRTDLGTSSARYGFDVTAAFDGRVSQQQMASNDIVTVFESMLLWYARQVDSGTPVEEVLGIMLMESNVPVRYPAESLQTLVDSVGVDETDTVADLLRAVEAEDGIQL